MTAKALQPLPDPQFPIAGMFPPTQPFAAWLNALHAVALLLNSGTIGPLTDAVDDAAAGVAGVAVGQLYRTGSAVKIRVT